MLFLKINKSSTQTKYSNITNQFGREKVHIIHVTLDYMFVNPLTKDLVVKLFHEASD